MNELAKTDATNAIVSDANTANATSWINTINLDTREGKVKCANAVNDAVSLNDHVGEVIEVVDILTMPGSRKDRSTNEMVDCQNTYLIAADGTCYMSQSNGVARSLAMIQAVMPDFGKNDPEGGISIVCKSEKLANGNELKTLKLV